MGFCANYSFSSVYHSFEWLTDYHILPLSTRERVYTFSVSSSVSRCLRATLYYCSFIYAMQWMNGCCRRCCLQSIFHTLLQLFLLHLIYSSSSQWTLNKNIRVYESNWKERQWEMMVWGSRIRDDKVGILVLFLILL